ncbi:MAG: lactate utilization protein [Gammaproteobacteria bacterium]|nr:lactate utilization protein [Gammaproteobacteria bacterium]
MATISSISLSARANILAKLKKEVVGADYSKLPPEPDYIYPDLTHQEQLAQFITHLENNHAQVIKTDLFNMAHVVTEQLKQRDIDSLLYGKNSQYSGHIEAIDSSITLSDFDFSIDKDNSAAKTRLFYQTPAGITGSRCSIAATGSIVLWPTPQEPRTLSLVPPVHFVIVDAKQLYSDFATLIKEQKWQQNLPTNAILISGPSKTADIQQTLAYGAHGPKELIVLLLNS